MRRDQATGALVYIETIRILPPKLRAYSAKKKKHVQRASFIESAVHKALGVNQI